VPCPSTEKSGPHSRTGATAARPGRVWGETDVHLVEDRTRMYGCTYVHIALEEIAMADPVVRITVNVTPEVAAQLDELAAKMNTTKTQAINQAITTIAAMYREQESGGELVVKRGNTQQSIELPKA
jgi:predicted transcriptional regulator